MSAPELPWWRASPTRRQASLCLLLLPGLIVQTLKLDPELLRRGGALLLIGIILALVAHAATRRSPVHPLFTQLLSAAHLALLLAALWPVAAPWWPLITGMTIAWCVAMSLGGSATNPLPPTLLAWCVAMSLARFAYAISFDPPLISLLDALWVAGAWLLGGLIAAGLKLTSVRALLAFTLPAALAWLSGGIASTALIVAAVLGAHVVSERRFLPAGSTGQIALAALAGLATAIIWMNGAAPLACVFVVLGLYGLSPWIEQRTVAAHRPRAGHP